MDNDIHLLKKLTGVFLHKVIMDEDGGIEITIEQEAEDEEDHHSEDEEVDDGDAPPPPGEIKPASSPPPWYQRMSSMLTSFLTYGVLVDVELVGGEGGSEGVWAHQLFLAHSSPFLNNLLRYPIRVFLRLKVLVWSISFIQYVKSS